MRVNSYIVSKKYPAYSEVWAVFDNDHRNDSPNTKPYIDEAFAEYRKLRNAGANINIAYSSLSFEYYLLLHFKHVYHRFEKTECYIKDKDNHIYLNCCSDDDRKQPLEGACDGELANECCINGYARKNKIWQESKVGDVISKMPKTPNVFSGIVNAYQIRSQAINCQSGGGVGSMNPYLNTYALTLRMMGYLILDINGLSIPYRKGMIELKIDNDSLTIKNASSVIFILSDECMGLYIAKDNTFLYINKIGNFDRNVLQPDTQCIIDMSHLVNTQKFAILEIEGRRVIVCHPYCSHSSLSQEKLSEHHLLSY